MGLSNFGCHGQISYFERFLQGAAPMPLALLYPFHAWPWTRTMNDKREMATVLDFRWHSRAFLSTLGNTLHTLRVAYV